MVVKQNHTAKTEHSKKENIQHLENICILNIVNICLVLKFTLKDQIK